MKRHDKFLMDVAKRAAQESKATRYPEAKTAAVISINGHIIMSACNGLPIGADDSEFEFKCPDCTGEVYDLGLMPAPVCTTCQGYGKVTNPAVHHGERNAIDTCTQLGISTKNTELHVTMSPCIECAKSILASGITRVVYDRKYRITDGIDYLTKYGIEVVQYLNKTK